MTALGRLLDRDGRRKRRAARRLRRAEDRLSNAQERLSKWGFGMTPSERRRMAEDIERLGDALDRAQFEAGGE